MNSMGPWSRRTVLVYSIAKSDLLFNLPDEDAGSSDGW